MTSETIIDPAAIAQVKSLGGQALLTRLVTIFQEASNTRLVAAKAAMADQDLQALHRELHSLRSSAGNLGCTALSAICQTIETAILREKDVDYPALMVDFEQEVAIAQSELGKLIESDD